MVSRTAGLETQDIVRPERERGIGLRNNNIYLDFVFFPRHSPSDLKFWDTTLFFNLGYVVVHDWRADR